jgi:hypothetical protein
MRGKGLFRPVCNKSPFCPPAEADPRKLIGPAPSAELYLLGSPEASATPLGLLAAGGFLGAILHILDLAYHNSGRRKITGCHAYPVAHGGYVTSQQCSASGLLRDIMIGRFAHG